MPDRRVSMGMWRWIRAQIPRSGEPQVREQVGMEKQSRRRKQLAERIGQKVGRYEIIDVLGRGGMGEIYKARDRALERDVALKFLPIDLAQDKTSRQRFLREARSLAKLDHPNIPGVYAIEKLDETYYIAFQYVEGRNLLRVLSQEKPVGVGRALRIIRQVAEALSATHAHGIVHRDIKPENIMVESDDSVKVLDFGLAKPMRGGTRITQTDMYLGTPEYCSPEQIRGEVLDDRSDLYSVGIVLFELLAGNPPFQNSETRQLYPSILNGKRPSIRKTRSSVPRNVDRLIQRLIAKDRDRRIDSAEQLIVQIDAILARLGDDDSRGMRVATETETSSARIHSPSSSRRSTTTGGIAAGGVARGLLRRVSSHLLFGATLALCLSPVVAVLRNRLL